MGPLGDLMGVFFWRGFGLVWGSFFVICPWGFVFLAKWRLILLFSPEKGQNLKKDKVIEDFPLIYSEGHLKKLWGGNALFGRKRYRIT